MVTCVLYIILLVSFAFLGFWLSSWYLVHGNCCINVLGSISTMVQYSIKLMPLLMCVLITEYSFDCRVFSCS